MNTTVSELLTRNLLSVFGERDADLRRHALEKIWLETGVFIDPEGQYVGFDAINDRICSLQNQYPEFEFIKRGKVNAMHDVGSLSWGYGPPENRDLVTGTDVATTWQGKIATLYAFVDE